jgi:maleate isomerase
MMLSLYRDEGFDVVDSATFDAGREDIVRRISPDSILQSAAALDLSQADAVFISCTTFRCAEMIESLESRCDKPVVTSNQASAWAALRAAGIGAAPRSRGRLFCEAQP